MARIVVATLLATAPAALAAHQRVPIDANALRAAETNQAECEALATRWFASLKSANGPVPRTLRTGELAEAAKDVCAADHSAGAKNYFCVEAGRFVNDALDSHRHDEDNFEWTVELACAQTEHLAHEAGIEVARVPGLHAEDPRKGAHQKHASSTAATFDPERDLAECGDRVGAFMTAARVGGAASQLADTWYSYCSSQNCGHMLPSRHRSCAVHLDSSDGAGQKHAHTVCELGRREAIAFAAGDAAVVASGRFDADDVCRFFAGFVVVNDRNVRAYNQLVHNGVSAYEPPAKERALRHAQLMNDRQTHLLRDGVAVASGAA